MKYANNQYTFAASDLSTYLSCRHATQLHKQYLTEDKQIPHYHDPVLEALIQRGAAHEKAYVDYLRARGLTSTSGERKSCEETIRAMAAGADVIVQGQLKHNEWSGYPDILIRVEGKSQFGNWQYEVQDTKLSRNTRTSAIIQLCFYTELLAIIQGQEPEKFAVVMPGDPFIIENFQFRDFKAYYNVVRKNFRTAINNNVTTYPEPVEHCTICNWWQTCNEQRRKDDHLSFVAGLRKTQIQDLKIQSIETLQAFALAQNLDRPKRGNLENLVKKKKQASIQYDARVKDTLLHEVVLPMEEKRGFNRLPEPSPGDVYIDIEGDAFFKGGSLEYLFGIVITDNNNELKYNSYWATTRAEEKQAFISVMEFILERMKKYPGLFIYHYGHYEPTTFKRLAHHYAVYEQELDDFLRRGKFVDLHVVVKEALIASVERYSLKDIEKFAQYTRQVDLREAGVSRKQLERSLQLNEFNSLPEAIIESVRGYNEDDCLATHALHQWLEGERTKLIKSGQSITRPVFTSDPPDEKLIELEKRSKLLFESLTKSLPEDRDTWNDEHKAKWLLANQLQYFRRENKTAWWEHFRLQKAAHDDLMEERKALVGLVFQKDVASTGRLPVHQYKFPDQETTLKEDDDLYVVNSYNEEDPIGIRLGTITRIDCENGLVEIKKTGKTIDLHPIAVHEYDVIGIEQLWRAILAIANEVDDNGLRRIGDYVAAKDLLMNRRPQLKTTDVVGIQPGEAVSDAATRLALNLNRSILPIQGPPGTGKTFTGAHIIINLIRAKKTVGVTAVSHRVITTLFETIYREAKKLSVAVDFVHKVTEKQQMPDWVKQHTDKKKIKKGIESYAITGGTAWLWADDDFRDCVDYLIVDEAGQMAMSQVLAASRACSNLILLGDPQQLEQPQRGAHPEGSGVAALTHLLEGSAVMPEGKGLFLDVTRRINPSIAKFTSEIFYDNKLKALPELSNQKISGGTWFDGDGLFYVPVEHGGNQNRSDEEIERVKLIVDNLLKSGSWSDDKGMRYRISPKDILVVAPYNAQVDGLKAKLKDVDVGTVDKFQGREAPVVIYAMTASTVEDAPRGMDFLFNPNRLNVATSRAKCICILVASPSLFEAECNTIEQMRWVNGLCRYRELSKEI
ncbi:TM0106 family RecB-like putative nuclease [Chryseosolibacter indicus]|uniref:TM0106 family RecB-like putative nuclease n=1 Tax=Chryseosolibacter indicus TaxID=2782351 RepID=A0ABS5VWY7_9BACT|nr:TM0106 family RecB-like putative nuclease [Chryseosolibacter indicus]MBT1705942.1 TM0106 family RecB-like putative nuclease [Chryseosolibacter indicus]